MARCEKDRSKSYGRLIVNVVRNKGNENGVLFLFTLLAFAVKTASLNLPADMVDRAC